MDRKVSDVNVYEILACCMPLCKMPKDLAFQLYGKGGWQQKPKVKTNV